MRKIRLRLLARRRVGCQAVAAAGTAGIVADRVHGSDRAHVPPFGGLHDGAQRRGQSRRRHQSDVSQAAVHNLLPRWTDLAASPRALFVGGPVKRDAALCLGIFKPGMSDDEKLGARPVDGRVAHRPRCRSRTARRPARRVRIFAGYAAGVPVSSTANSPTEVGWSRRHCRVTSRPAGRRPVVLGTAPSAVAGTAAGHPPHRRPAQLTWVGNRIHRTLRDAVGSQARATAPQGSKMVAPSWSLMPVSKGAWCHFLLADAGVGGVWCHSLAC